MEDLAIILVVTLGGAGATFLFTGNLIAVVTTIGINRRWGMASLFVPLLPVVFCCFHRKQAAYALQLTAIGFTLLSAALVISYGVYQSTLARRDPIETNVGWGEQSEPQHHSPTTSKRRAQ